MHSWTNHPHLGERGGKRERGRERGERERERVRIMNIINEQNGPKIKS